MVECWKNVMRIGAEIAWKRWKCMRYIWNNQKNTFAGTPTATTSMAYLPAGEVEVIKVSPGEKMAAIRTSGDGTLFCTELSA